MRKRKKVRCTVAEALEAKHVASIYKRQRKAFNFSAKKPWRTDKPFEELPVFGQFVEAVRLIEDLQADPRDFVRAQFECWNGPPSTFPWPSHLISQGAVDRYNRWYEDNRAVERVKAPKLKKGDFTRDERKLRQLTKRTGLDTKAALKRDPALFSRGFLKHHGVWEEVKDDWVELHG